MNFIQSISTCMRKYVTFSGRATRSEFWWFYLFTVLVNFAAGFKPYFYEYIYIFDQLLLL